jgi:GNAT superfamily N-acetyltransferase
MSSTVVEELLLLPLSADSREALEAMYARFEPKGSAMGLPPRSAQELRAWLDSLQGYVSLVVCEGPLVVAHGILCPEGSSAEVAVFVHQDYRSKGLGRKLLSELIQRARQLGLKRVWGMTEWDNVPMLRLAHSLGFVSASDPREFHLDLR